MAARAFFDYGPGTDSEKYIPDIRLINDPDRPLTMDEVFDLSQDKLVYLDGDVWQVVNSNDNYAVKPSGVKRAVAIKFVKKGKWEGGGSRRSRRGRGRGSKGTRRCLSRRR